MRLVLGNKLTHTVRVRATCLAMLLVLPVWCAAGPQEPAPSEVPRSGPPSPLNLSPGPQGGTQIPSGTGSSRKAQAGDPAGMASSPSGSGVTVGSAPVEGKSYIIGAEDIIGIQVWQVREMSGQYLVRPDGKISVPLVGDVVAAGKTPQDVSGALAELLKKKYINSPDVTVSVLQVNSKKYYIHGEVNNPGPFPLIVPTTVLEGLANARGFRDFANVKKIRIMRGKEQLMFNYRDVTRGKKTEQNIYLQPGDEIIVP